MSRLVKDEHYIYVPGFGGSVDWLRQIALWTWRLRGVSTSMVKMRWNDPSETVELKLGRLHAELKKHEGSDITLIGESAGGAMVVYATNQYPGLINRLVTIAGYNRGNEQLHPKYSDAHPAFAGLTQLAETANQAFSREQRARAVTIVSPSDRIVPERYSYIEGARIIRLATKGHMSTIRYVLSRTLKNII